MSDNDSIAVAIFGCGQTGLALSYFLSKRGSIVTLFENKNHSTVINKIKQQRGIKVTGLYNDFFHFDNFSIDIEEILKKIN